MAKGLVIVAVMLIASPLAGAQIDAEPESTDAGSDAGITTLAVEETESVPVSDETATIPTECDFVLELCPSDASINANWTDAFPYSPAAGAEKASTNCAPENWTNAECLVGEGCVAPASPCLPTITESTPRVDLVAEIDPPSAADDSGSVVIGGRVRVVGEHIGPVRYELRHLIGNTEIVLYAAADVEGSNTTHEFSVPWTAAEGLQRLRLVADPDHRLPEIDETNNQATTFIEGPIRTTLPSVAALRIEDATGLPLPLPTGMQPKQTNRGLAVSLRTNGTAVARLLADIHALSAAVGAPLAAQGEASLAPRGTTDFYAVEPSELGWIDAEFVPFVPSEHQTIFGWGSPASLLFADRPMRVRIKETPTSNIRTDNETDLTIPRRAQLTLSLDDGDPQGQPIWIKHDWLRGFGLENVAFAHQDGAPILARRIGSYHLIEPKHFSEIHAFETGLESWDLVNNQQSSFLAWIDKAIYMYGATSDPEDESLVRDFVPGTAFNVSAIMTAHEGSSQVILYPLALGRRTERENQNPADNQAPRQALGFRHIFASLGSGTTTRSVYDTIEAFYTDSAGVKTTVWTWSPSEAGISASCDQWYPPSTTYGGIGGRWGNCHYSYTLRLRIDGPSAYFELLAGGSIRRTQAVSQSLLPLATVDALFLSTEEAHGCDDVSWWCHASGSMIIDEIRVETTKGNMVNDAFASGSAWLLQASAAISEGTMSLVPNTGMSAGVATSSSTLTASRFAADFRYRLGPGTLGTEGLAFMFYKETGYTPATGAALGFADTNSATNVGHRGYGIELDATPNAGDPSSAHIALIKDDPTNHLAYVNVPNLADGQWHTLSMHVADNRIAVYRDGLLVLKATATFSRDFGGFGFAAATSEGAAFYEVDDLHVSAITVPPVNTPPYAPSDLKPENGATGTDLSVSLTWKGGDMDGTSPAYTVFLGTNSPPTTVRCASVVLASCTVSSLAYQTTYYWKVEASDGLASTSSGVQWFKTRPADRPPVVRLSSPGNGSIDTAVAPTLTWSASDPDGNKTFSTVYLGTNPSPTAMVCTNTPGQSCVAGGLVANTTYYWYVSATDGFQTAKTAAWSFKTGQPPYVPSSPFPISLTWDHMASINLTWKGGDPDGTSPRYDVYFGTGSLPSELKCQGLLGETCNTGVLNYNTRYYWRVRSTDSGGSTVESPIWNFRTAPNVPPYSPDYLPSAVGANGGTLRWIGGDPNNRSVTYTVYYNEVTPVRVAGTTTRAAATTIKAPDVVGDRVWCSNVAAPTCRVSLRPNTQYYWWVSASDGEFRTWGPIWWFQTPIDQVPSVPSTPSPPEKAWNVPRDVGLAWSGADPDGSFVTYRVRFGKENPPPSWNYHCYAQNQASAPDPNAPFCDATDLDYDTTYYWQVEVSDGSRTVTGPVWSFRTLPSPVNHPPKPAVPVWPTDGAGGVNPSTVLYWEGGDIDGTTPWYDVVISHQESVWVYDEETRSGHTEWYEVEDNGCFTQESECRVELTCGRTYSWYVRTYESPPAYWWQNPVYGPSTWFSTVRPVTDATGNELGDIYLEDIEVGNREIPGMMLYSRCGETDALPDECNGVTYLVSSSGDTINIDGGNYDPCIDAAVVEPARDIVCRSSTDEDARSWDPLLGEQNCNVLDCWSAEYGFKTVNVETGETCPLDQCIEYWGTWTLPALSNETRATACLEQAVQRICANLGAEAPPAAKQENPELWETYGCLPDVCQTQDGEPVGLADCIIANPCAYSNVLAASLAVTGEPAGAWFGHLCFDSAAEAAYCQYAPRNVTNVVPCVTYRYNGQNQTVPLGMPGIFTTNLTASTSETFDDARCEPAAPGSTCGPPPETTSAGAAILWFVGAPILAPGAAVGGPITSVSAIGVAGSFLTLTSSPNAPTAVNASFEVLNITLGVLSKSNAPAILSGVTQFVREVFSAPAADSTDQVLPNKDIIDADLRLTSAMTVGDATVYGKILGHQYTARQSASTAPTGSQRGWNLHLTTTLNATVIDPTSKLEKGSGTTVDATWQADAAAKLTIRFDALVFEVADMPRAVTGIQIGMVEKKPEMFVGINWPAEQHSKWIQIFSGARKLLNATDPPTSFLLGYEFTRGEAADSTPWEYVTVDLKGTRTNLAASMDAFLNVGKITANLTDVDDNLHVSFGRELAVNETGQVSVLIGEPDPNSNETSPIPAFTLTANGGAGNNVNPIIGRALIADPSGNWSVLLEDIVSAKLDTAKAANMGGDGNTNSVVFGPAGNLEATWVTGKDNYRLGFSGLQDQALKLSLYLSTKCQEFNTLYVKTGNPTYPDLRIVFDFRLGKNNEPMVSLVNLAGADINWADGQGHMRAAFVNGGSVLFDSKGGSLSPSALMLLDENSEGCDTGGGSGGGQSTYLNADQMEVFDLTVGPEMSDVPFVDAPKITLAWRQWLNAEAATSVDVSLGNKGGLDLGSLWATIAPSADFQEDKINWDASKLSELICHEQGDQLGIRTFGLDHEGETVVKCGDVLRFTTIGMSTAASLAAELVGNVEDSVNEL